MKQYRFVNKIGVELEGGWDNPGFSVGRDGSVTTSAAITGEIASPPLLPADAPAWLMKHYPDVVNKSCGMHVHVSMKSRLAYARLMERHFYDHVIEKLLLWGKENKVRKTHPFWERLAGKNQYCMNSYCPEKQMWYREKSGARYSILNYCWARYGTIEVRVLPGFIKPERGVAAVMAVVNIFEDYLRNYTGGREKRLKESIEFNEDPETLPREELDLDRYTANAIRRIDWVSRHRIEIGSDDPPSDHEVEISPIGGREVSESVEISSEISEALTASI